MYGNIEKNLSIEQICTEFDLSASYVNAIFLKHMHDTPKAFFIKLKIQEACSALRGTNRFINEIAQSVGYKDQYHFSRIFKKLVGVSPKAYRDNAKTNRN